MPTHPLILPAYWRTLLDTCSKLEMHAPGIRQALFCLAHPDGFLIDDLPADWCKTAKRASSKNSSKNTGQRLARWARNGWLERSDSGILRPGRPSTRFTPTPAFHALLPLPPRIAARMSKHLEVWYRLITEHHPDHHPMRLFACLVECATCTCPNGYPAPNGHIDVPYLNYSCDPNGPRWRLLHSLGLVTQLPRLPGDSKSIVGRLFLTPHGRKVLGLH